MNEQVEIDLANPANEEEKTNDQNEQSENQNIKENPDFKRAIRQRRGFKEERNQANEKLKVSDAKLNDAEKRISFLEGQLDSLNKAPKKEDYQNDDDYIDALSDFKANKKESERLKKQADIKNQKPLEKDTSNQLPTHVSEMLQDVIEDGEDKFDGFHDLISDGNLAFSVPVVSDLVTRNDAYKLFYHLANNPKELKAISIKKGREVSKAITKLSQDIKGTKPGITQTPDPITPVKNSGGKSVNEDNMSTAEYIKFKNKEQGFTLK